MVALNAPNVPAGVFKFDIAGTPKQLKITQFSHQGKEGYINANGSFDMTNGIGWHINADMKNFDASYFVPSLLPNHWHHQYRWLLADRRSVHSYRQYEPQRQTKKINP